MKEKRRLQKEGVEDAGSDAGHEEGEEGNDDDDLFGEGPETMDIG